MSIMFILTVISICCLLWIAKSHPLLIAVLTVCVIGLMYLNVINIQIHKTKQLKEETISTATDAKNLVNRQLAAEERARKAERRARIAEQRARKAEKQKNK